MMWTSIDIQQDWGPAVLYTSALATFYVFLVRPIYNVYVHPLRQYPGPKIWAASGWPWTVMFLSGKSHDTLLALHEKYGSVVRIGPNELSFTAPEAWEDIFGRPQAGLKEENPKAPWYLSENGTGLLGASYSDHNRMRRLMANGFSATAMVEQQPKIQEHVSLLIEKLKTKVDRGDGRVDLCEWYNFCTFDIIGELALGEPFGCLREAAMHPWISLIFSNIKLTAMLLVCNRMPLLYILMPLFVSWSLIKGYKEHQKVTEEKLEKRLADPLSKPDFITNMLSDKGSIVWLLHRYHSQPDFPVFANNHDQKMTRKELSENAVILTLAGSETTASALCGATYLLTQQPIVMAKLQAEVHQTFALETDINLVAVANLPYMRAVTQEALRIYPPGPNSQPRITPPQGNIVLGRFVPGNTVLGIPHRATYLSSHHFHRAREFLPERWLATADDKDSPFRHDRGDSFKPFSHGPRNCIGMNLAYAEMRLILARMVWNFDITLASESQGWMDRQLSYLIWEKPPLHVHLKASRRAS